MKFNLLAASLVIVGLFATQGSAAPKKPKQLDTCTQTSTSAGAHYSSEQIATVAKSAGFTGNGWVIAVAIAIAESQGWTQAVLINTDCSRDRGLWQINSRWHSEVSDAQAFDPTGNARAAFTISSGGSNWQPWTTYTSGAYQSHMADAQTAVNSVNGGGGGGGGGSGGASCPHYGRVCPPSDHCCSQYGYCGSTSEFCGAGCVAAASYNGVCA
ncbi:hypothetical protein BC938DRAFT_482414 [Jimgerdemannia flammicorona]|uniref:Chitin-binding type-1 domain-containing protein n=1 Tax=Jimgerdemannia flammicorona TaxID=994334 RepID=A0A433QE68_9FUNG|nr:hypothetical protein BC938DRAFT_482414 [Jimgerdemannia flammicorona]